MPIPASRFEVYLRAPSQQAWNDPAVAQPTWDRLSRIEHDLMICAMESWGILPHACDVDDSGHVVSAIEVAAKVLDLVDRGWIDVHRLEPWTSPDGVNGATYGLAIPRAELDELLANVETWAEPSSSSWIGAVTLAETDLGRQITRRAGS